MKLIIKLFCDHPTSVGETYGDHFLCANHFAWRLLFAGCVCLVHSIFPFLFVKTASRQVENLHEVMVANRQNAKHHIAQRRSASAKS